MLFLSVFTFNAKDHDAVIKRCALGGKQECEGVQVLLEHVDLSKHRVFRVTEVPDTKAIWKANRAWNDLGEIESVLVMETEGVWRSLIG
ncbi:MAG: hypothetical protein AMJ92_12035 [candidate division Zixibacteria bacterium SM23_81]|nr:MAG: hypothetical protein AMJ92_12035 [candidate division Zixibacteria bacterium SM23_81]